MRAAPCRDARAILDRAAAVRALTRQLDRLRTAPRPDDAARAEALAADPRFLARHGIAGQPAEVARARVPAQADAEETCVVAFYARDWATAVPACMELAAQGDATGDAALAAIWLQADPPAPAEALVHADKAARAGVRGAQLLTAALLIDAAPPSGPLPQEAVAWLARAAGQGVEGVQHLIPAETAVSGVLPAASPIDGALEAALQARARGQDVDEATLLPVHRAWLARLWASPAVQARLKVGAGQG